MSTSTLLSFINRSSCKCRGASSIFQQSLRDNWTKSTKTKIPSSVKKLQIGDPLPNVNLYEDTPENAILASELYKGKKGVLFAVVGAFTPGCTNEEGYMISCVAVNDPFVMKAWAESTNSVGKIRMLADPRGEFTKALGMELDCKSLLGGIRSLKYSLVINDGIVQGFNVDPEHTGLACLLCIKSMTFGDDAGILHMLTHKRPSLH